MQTFMRKKINDRVTFPLTLNMNHFLNETKQNDPLQTEELIKLNPLNEVRPAQFKAAVQKQAQADAAQRVKANEVQARYDENLKRELGELDDANLAPNAVGQMKQKRDEEKKRQALEHKKRMAAMKKKKKTTAGPSRFAKGGLNQAFMANAKKEKDGVQGWAFDFSNPDAGQGQTNEELAIIESVKQESLREAEALKEQAQKTGKDEKQDVQDDVPMKDE